MILKMLSVGKPELALDDFKLISMANASFRFIEGIAYNSHRPILNTKIIELSDFYKEIEDDCAFKFTDAAGLEFIRNGRIMLTPPAFYRQIENKNAWDGTEGFGFLYFLDEQRCASVYTESGFNALVICATRSQPMLEASEFRHKFGSHLIKISGVREFAARIAALSGASSWQIQDVFYSDAKVARTEGRYGREWANFIEENGDARMELYHYVADRNLDDLIRLSEPHTVFCKPTSYRGEQERRFLFRYPSNMPTKVFLDDAKLARHIEVIA